MEIAQHFRIINLQSSRDLLLEAEIMAKQLCDTYISREHVFEWWKFWTCYYFFPLLLHISQGTKQN